MMRTMILLFLRSALLRGSKRRDGRIHVVFVARTISKQHKTRNCRHKGRKKRQRKEKKMYLGFQIFLKGRDKRETRAHFFHFTRVLYYSCSFSVEQKKRTRNVGWNAVRAPSHAEGTKKCFLSFCLTFMSSLTRVFTTTRRRDVFVFSNDERGLPPSSKETLDLGVDFSL